MFDFPLKISHNDACTMVQSINNTGYLSFTFLRDTYIKITTVNLSAFVYRLFHEVFLPSSERICSDDWKEIFMKQPVNKYDKLTSDIFVHKALI